MICIQIIPRAIRKAVLRLAAVILLLPFFSFEPAVGQNSIIHLHFKKSKTRKVDIRFEMIHNLIVVPVFINSSDTLRFILDTGVSNTMLTNTAGAVGLSFNFAREINLYGLGEGREVKAYHSFGNVIEMPGVIGFNHNVIILKDDFDFLSQGLGTQINGLLGYDVFDSFVVEIDYKSRKLTLYDPSFYRQRKREKFLKRYTPLAMEIKRRKPFVEAELTGDNNQTIKTNLLIDTGASHAISLFRSSDSRLQIPDHSLYSFIGVGLSGDIYGFIGREKRFSLAGFRFKKPLITYPDEEAVQITGYEKKRSGSVGSDIMKRFTVVFDYHGGEVLLKPNSMFNNEFKYNLSGMDLTTPIPDFPMYQISKIREGSPAWIAGLEVGDQIVSVNGIEVSEYSLSGLIEIFQSRPGRTLRIDIKRKDQLIAAKFTLEDPIK